MSLFKEQTNLKALRSPTLSSLEARSGSSLISSYIGCLDTERPLRWATFRGPIFFTSDLAPFLMPWCDRRIATGEKQWVWFEYKPCSEGAGTQQGGEGLRSLAGCSQEECHLSGFSDYIVPTCVKVWVRQSVLHVVLMWFWYRAKHVMICGFWKQDKTWNRTFLPFGSLGSNTSPNQTGVGSKVVI